VCQRSRSAITTDKNQWPGKNLDTHKFFSCGDCIRVPIWI
jgi:hypothetical protein